MRDYWTAAQRLVGSLAACEAFLEHFSLEFIFIFWYSFINSPIWCVSVLQYSSQKTLQGHLFLRLNRFLCKKRIWVKVAIFGFTKFLQVLDISRDTFCQKVSDRSYTFPFYKNEGFPKTLNKWVDFIQNKSCKPPVPFQDCLYLNVYVPSNPRNSSGPLPVAVWLHGGAFMFGSGSACWFGPQFWMVHDIILVTQISEKDDACHFCGYT